MNQKQNIPYFVAVAALTYIMIKPGILWDIASFYHYAPLKFVLSMLIIKNRGLITKQIKVYYNSFKRRLQTSDEMVHGVPLNELVDYILKGTYKAPEVVELFGLSHNKANKLGKEIDSLGIMTRDANNGRVLADMSRKEIVALLKGKKPLEVRDVQFFVRQAI